MNPSLTGYDIVLICQYHSVSEVNEAGTVAVWAVSGVLMLKESGTAEAAIISSLQSILIDIYRSIVSELVEV